MRVQLVDIRKGVGVLVRLAEIKRIGPRRLEPLQVVFHNIKTHNKNSKSSLNQGLLLNFASPSTLSSYPIHMGLA